MGLLPELTLLDGNPMPPEQLEGKVVLVVNVASKCGFTKQYDGLQALHERYQGQGLVVLGVPCNQFGSQEPGTGDEIQSFCRMNFGVSFPLLAKQDVGGENRGALYSYLLKRRTPVLWNFEKFLLGRDGKVAKRFRSVTQPDAKRLTNAIEGALAAG